MLHVHSPSALIRLTHTPSHTRTHTTYSSCRPGRQWPTSVPRFRRSACVGSGPARWPSRLLCAGAPGGRSCAPTASWRQETCAGKPTGRTTSCHWAGCTRRRYCYRGGRRYTDRPDYVKDHMQMYIWMRPELEVADRAVGGASTPPTPEVISAFIRPRYFLTSFGGSSKAFA